MALASVYGNILLGVQRLLVQLTLPDVSATSVKIRKKAVYLAKHDALPLVLVCFDTEHLNAQTMGGSAGKDFLGYPVWVVLVRENTFQYEDVLWQPYCREKVRQALRVTGLAEAPEVHEQAGYDPQPVFDLSALDAGFDSSVQGFTYNASEARNG